MKKDMSDEFNKLKELLQKQYNSIINLDGKGFFLGLADYVDFVLRKKPLLDILQNSIFTQYEEDTKKLKVLKEKAKQELQKEGEKLIKEIIEAFWPCFQKVLENSQRNEMELLKLPSEAIHEPALVEKIEEIIRTYQNTFPKTLTPARIAKINSLMRSIKKKFLSSQICKEYARERNYQEYLKESAKWNSWLELKLIYDLIYQRKKIEQKIEKGNDLEESVALMFLVGEMDMILEKRPVLPIFHKFNISYRNFTKKEYLFHLTRIHNHLIEQLTFLSSTQQKEVLKNTLSSIHLLTHSLEPKDTIFLVLDRHFEMPIRCAVKNKRGEPTYIKKLYDIAYIANAPGKRVEYNKRLADNINNGLFKRRRVAEYMKTNKLKKPTLVQKSEDGNYLVLKNEVIVKTGLVKHEVPLQYQSLYIDKTN